jgi:hypothetical protein
LIMTDEPRIEFGKRRPVRLPDAPPQPLKRSNHVALLAMGAFAVGAGAYAVMDRQSCQPTPPAVASSAVPTTTAVPPPPTTCTSHGWSSGGGSGYHRSSSYSFYGDSPSSSGSSASEGVTRGGFGSFARAFGFSGHS